MDVTTQHLEHLGSYWTWMLQRSTWSVLEVARDGCGNVACRTSWKLLEIDVTTNCLKVATHGKAENTISNRGYSLYQPQILKTRVCDKPFLNRRYCLTTHGDTGKTISNRGYSLYQPQIFKTRLCDKPFLNGRYCLTNGEADKIEQQIFIVPTPNSQDKSVRQTVLKQKILSNK